METTRIEMKGDPSIRQVAEIYGEVKQAIEAGNALNFDLGEAKSVDTSVLQLLLAGSKYTRGEEVAGEITEASESLISLFRESGAMQLVQDDTTAEEDAE